MWDGDAACQCDEKVTFSKDIARCHQVCGMRMQYRGKGVIRKRTISNPPRTVLLEVRATVCNTWFSRSHLCLGDLEYNYR